MQLAHPLAILVAVTCQIPLITSERERDHEVRKTNVVIVFRAVEEFNLVD